MLQSYDWILFDADETLFHFDKRSGLINLFKGFGFEFTDQDFSEFQAINNPLWEQYQNGEISAQEIKKIRFSGWTQKTQRTSLELNDAFIDEMLLLTKPLEGAMQLLDDLKDKAQLGIITNGFTDMQSIRLKHLGLTSHFDLLVASEEVGVAKPHPDIFDHALSLAGNPMRDRALMIGDNPHSDILGGMNAGIDTCWLNVNGHPLPDGIKPNYQVSSLTELATILLA